MILEKYYFNWIIEGINKKIEKYFFRGMVGGRGAEVEREVVLF